jgi:hypothetical protein
MPKRLAMLVTGMMLAGAHAHAQSASDALRTLLHPTITSNSIQTLYGLLLGETTTFPIGSSAGGFTWIFDSNLRAPVRRTQSFGPMFAERPFTTGKGKVNIGVSFQHTTFSSVGGQSLTDLVDSQSYRSGEEIYRSNTSLEVSLDRTIFSATFGIHDRVDIGVIVPVGRARVSGFSSHYYLNDGVVDEGRDDSRGSSFGPGDTVVRTKVAVVSKNGFDVAAALDLRLPTGDPEKLLGVGQTQVRAMFIGGMTLGQMNPHVNLGYLFGGSGMKFGADNRWEGSVGDPELIRRDPSEEFTYTAGLDVAATPAVTIAGDLIGRIVRNSAGMNQVDTGPGGGDRVIYLDVRPGTVHQLLGAVSAKVRVAGSWLATGTILFPLKSRGIKPGVTPVIGFERAF